MVKPEETIKSEIKEYIKKHDGAYPDWYVGVAEDPKKRLFEDHNVDKERDWWIYRQCEDSDTARRIEKYFVDVLGTDGETGGGSEDTIYVYAYKKTSQTVE